MSPRGLARLLLGYALLLVVACMLMHSHATLRELLPSEQRVVESRWAALEQLQQSPGKGDAPA